MKSERVTKDKIDLCNSTVAPLTENMANIDTFGMEVATRGVNTMVKPGTTSEIANIALFLASEESSYINGVTLAADFGWSAY